MKLLEWLRLGLGLAGRRAKGIPEVVRIDIQRLRRILRVWKHAIMNLLVAMFSCALCLAFVEIMTKLQGEQRPDGVTGMLLGAFVLMSVIVVSPLFLIYAVWNCFQQPRKRGILVAASAYLGMIVAFAGGFYAMQFFSELLYCTFYHEYVVFHSPDVPKPSAANEYAFRGLSQQFLMIKPALATLMERQEALEAKGLPIDDVRSEISARYINRRDIISFNTAARFPIFVDALHFSVIATTTVGFGDITPATWYAKLATDIEILSGIAILGLAIGVILSRRK